LETPKGIAVDGNGNVYIVDSEGGSVFKVDLTDGPALTFANTAVGATSSDSPQIVTLENAGNAPLTLPIVSGENNPNVGGEFSLNSSGPMDCPVVNSGSSGPSTLAAGAFCLLPISFSPTSQGFTQSNGTIWDNNLNPNPTNYASQSILLQGTGLQEQSQSINFAAITSKTVETMLGLSATATSGLAVSFSSLTPSICSVSADTASLIAGGTCTIQASQAGNNQYGPAQNVDRSFMVNFLSQTISFGGIANQSAGTTPPLSASASSGLAVSFSSLTPSVCTVSGTTASLNTGGICTIQASQAGDAQYAAAANVDRSFNVNHATQSIGFSAIGNQSAATNLNLSATATSGLTVSFASLTSSTCTVSVNTASLIGAGECIIQASQAGNSEYAAAANVNVGFTVNHAAQSISFAAIGNQSAATNLNLSATATSGLAVSFASVTPSVCTVSGNTASLIAAGVCGIQASQAGNSEYAAAPTVLHGFSVNHATQTINFSAIGNQSAATNLNLSATATSGLMVGFASLTPSVCTVSGNTASLIAAGVCTLEATQAGNSEYAAAASVGHGFNVNHAAQSISFSAIGNQSAATMVNLSATATSGLAVSFVSLTPSVCTVSGSTASLIAAGVCTLEATQAGNSEYAAAPNVSRSFNVNHAAQSINFPAIGNQIRGTALHLSASTTSGLAAGFASLTPSTCSVSGNTASLFAAGVCTLQASQAGNNEYAAAPNVSHGFNVNP
jgi:hypothetical protein